MLTTSSKGWLMAVSKSVAESSEQAGWLDWAKRFITPRRTVWLLWLVLSLNAIRFVAMISHPIPVWDDWAFVPYITGDEPATAEWLWAPHNDHRMPIGKVILLLMVRVFEGDFRTQVYFNLFTMIGIAAGLLYLAQRIRGRAAYTDAFFPLALLHCGHVDMYLGIGTITHTIAVAAGLALIGIILASSKKSTRLQSLGAGLCIMMIPLCGAVALPLVPAGICWLGLNGLQKFRESGKLRSGRLDWSIALAGSVLLVLYFVGFTGDDSHGRAATLQEFVSITAQASTMTVLPAQWMQRYWPLILFIVPCTVIAALVRLTRESLNFSSPKWLTASGGLLFLLASLVPALAIGWSRGFVGPLAGTATRYGFFLFPIVATVYLTFVTFEKRRFSNVVPIVLCCTALVGLRYNLKRTYTTAMVYYNSRDEFTQDVRAGATVSTLVDKYCGTDAGKLIHRPETLRAGINAMRRRGFGIFAEIQEERYKEFSDGQPRLADDTADRLATSVVR